MVGNFRERCIFVFFASQKTFAYRKRFFNTNQCRFAFAQGCHGSYWSPIQQLLLVLPYIFANTKSIKICDQTNQLTNYKVFQTRCVHKISEEKFINISCGLERSFALSPISVNPSQEKVYLRIIRREELQELRHYSRSSNLQSQNQLFTKLWDNLMVDETRSRLCGIWGSQKYLISCSRQHLPCTSERTCGRLADRLQLDTILLESSFYVDLSTTTSSRTSSHLSCPVSPLPSPLLPPTSASLRLLSPLQLPLPLLGHW